MPISGGLLKLAVIFAVAGTVLMLFVGMYFFLLTPSELFFGCVVLEKSIGLDLPCSDVSEPSEEDDRRFLGLCMVVTAVYLLYFIRTRYGNL